MTARVGFIKHYSSCGLSLSGPDLHPTGPHDKSKFGPPYPPLKIPPVPLYNSLRAARPKFLEKLLKMRAERPKFTFLEKKCCLGRGSAPLSPRAPLLVICQVCQMGDPALIVVLSDLNAQRKTLILV